MNSIKMLALLTAATFTTLLGPVCYAVGFVAEVSAPNFKILLPNIPEFKLQKHPSNAANPHMKLLGSQGPYTISVLAPTADKGMTANDCASALIQSFSKRPGLPPAESIYKARINSNTFIAIYVLKNDKLRLLNAHIMSAAGGTHCVEVHVAKETAVKEDVEPWFKAFGDANIVPQ